MAHFARALRTGALLVLAPAIVLSQDLAKEFEKRVTEFTLPNGLHFIVAERHEAPVVSFHTYVAAGAVDDPSGATGLAHMFEHMAFKGTETIGTTNWAAEKKALDAIEQVYDRLDAERNKGPKADPAKINALDKQLRDSIETAQSLVEPNEFSNVIEESGGSDLNASTENDATEYFYSLPSNRLELWFLLESQRFLHPVFREFYKERDVVMEEYRMRVESNPQGKLIQSMLAAAFAAEPYRNPAGGWPTDIANLRLSDANRFYQRYYVPGNMTMGIVGDVNPAEARRLAEKYFGPLPARPMPPRVHTEDPPQDGPKTVTVSSPSQPMELVAYKRPSQYDKDDAVFDILEMVLSSGRTGMMYKEMVQDKKIALGAQAIATFPGGRYPSLFGFFLVPALGHTLEENEKALDDMVTRLKTQKVDAAALKRAKTLSRATVIRRLANNSGLAALLTSYSANYGDWRKLFTSLDELNAVTADDVQRVAQKYFVPAARTKAYLVTEGPQGEAGGRQ